MSNEEYLNLITSLYRDKPKFITFMTNLLNGASPPFDLAMSLDALFDLDLASDSRLDTLGSIVGVSRTVPFTPSDGSPSTLPDNYYRTMIKAKIAKNLWDGEINSLSSIWSALFPEGVIILHDNQNMTMNVFVSGELPLVVRELIKYGYIVPKPQSVRIEYFFFSPSGKKVFGYDIENEYISGYDRANWAFAEELVLFSYDENSADRAGYDRGAW